MSQAQNIFSNGVHGEEKGGLPLVTHRHVVSLLDWTFAGILQDSADLRTLIMDLYTC